MASVKSACRKASRAGAAALAAWCAAPLAAQVVSGRISGTVADGTGAAVPGVTITVRHDGTGLARTAVTDTEGAYVVTHLPVGSYTVNAELQGFKRVVSSGNSLVADGRLTVNFRLELGTLAETVQVTAQTGEAVNTVSGEIARTVTQEQVRGLALNGRNYLELATLIPGAPVLNDDPIEAMVGLSINTSINGGRTNTNNLMVDGAYNMASGSNNSQMSNVGVDFIQEVAIKTSNFSAEYGRQSGANVNVVTKAGTNRYHGSLFEHHRDERLDANNYFLKQRGVAKAPLDFDNFGWSLGGPAKRDKIFFFAGQEWKQVRRFTDATRRTLPTRAERAGDFSARANVYLKDPRKPGACNADDRSACFPDPKRVPADLITPDGRAIAAVFEQMEKLARSYEDRAAGNNALFQGDNPFDNRQDFIRVDWAASEAHQLYGRFIFDTYNNVDPYGTFINAQLPTIPTRRTRPGRNLQFGHTWRASASLINQATATAVWNSQRMLPAGEYWKRASYGFQFPQIYAGGGRFEESIPAVTVEGFATFEGAARSMVSPTTDIAFADTLTIVAGAHSLKAGGLFTRGRIDQNGRTQYAGSVRFDDTGNPNSTGNAFADALLGNFRSYTEAEVDPLGFFRFSQLDLFVSDNWRLSRSLSLELGARYQYHVPFYTQANNISNFDPSRYDPARAVAIDPRTGNLVGGQGDRYNGIVRAGDGVPRQELGRVPIGDSPRVLGVPAGAPPGLYRSQGDWMPRLSFAWSPGGSATTAVRGGVGVFYDRPEGNIIFSAANNPPFNESVSYENANLASPSSGRPSALGAWGTIQAIDPNLQVPRVTNWSLSVQRELPLGLFGEIAYVGAAGRRLLRLPEINKISFDDLRASRALPASARPHDNSLRPYKGFASIRLRTSDAESNYNALQLYFAKRRGDLTFTLAYTYGRALTNASGNGDDLDPGDDPYGGLDLNYGPASYHRRHIFSGTYIYRVPLFRNATGLAKAVLDGWELSATSNYQSGRLLTVEGSTSVGTRRADFLGGQVSLPRSQRGPERWFNTAAFAAAPNDRRGTAPVGNVEGPGLRKWDVSLRKQTPLAGDVQMTLQLDVFNAFNQVNLGNPNTTVTNSSFGQISTVGPPRQLQLGVRLDF